LAALYRDGGYGLDIMDAYVLASWAAALRGDSYHNGPNYSFV
jgi:hypothetical protein